MDFLALVKTKTFWLGVVTAGFGIYQIVVKDPEAFQTISIGLGMIFGREAIEKINRV